MKASPPATSPRHPARRCPSAIAISVEFGPGMRLVTPRRSRNSSAGSHARRRTISASIIARCAAGPPKPAVPSQRNTPTTSRRRALTGAGVIAAGTGGCGPGATGLLYDAHASAGPHARRAGRHHRLERLVVLHAPGRLDAHVVADHPAHEGDVCGGRAPGPEPGGGLDVVGACRLGERAGGHLLFVPEERGLDDHLAQDARVTAR